MQRERVQIDNLKKAGQKNFFCSLRCKGKSRRGTSAAQRNPYRRGGWRGWLEQNTAAVIQRRIAAVDFSEEEPAKIQAIQSILDLYKAGELDSFLIN
jgi:hypothetical protein